MTETSDDRAATSGEGQQTGASHQELMGQETRTVRPTQAHEEIADNQMQQVLPLSLHQKTKLMEMGKKETKNKVKFKSIGFIHTAMWC